MASPIFFLMKKFVDDEWVKLDRNQITPWTFFNTRNPFEIRDHYGGQIGSGGVEFSGTIRDVFWNRYIEPFIEDIADRAFNETLRIAQARNHTADKALEETSGLLNGLSRKAFRRMAEIDQRLRGNGYPDSVPREDTGSREREVADFIEARAAAEVAMLPRASLGLNEEGGLTLGDPSPPPSLEKLSVEGRVQAMTEWFLENFEEPVQHMPIDEGEFVFIWGGPFDARDELDSAFGDVATGEELEEAYSEITADGTFEWAPHDKRIVPEVQQRSGFSAPRANQVNLTYDNVADQLDWLEGYLAQLRISVGQIGHNNPPAEMSFAPTVGEIEEVRATIAAVRLELANPSSVNPNVLQVSSDRLQAFGWKLTKFILWVGAAAATGAIGTIAKLTVEDLILHHPEAAQIVHETAEFLWNWAMQLL